MRLYQRHSPAIAIEQKVNTRNPRSTVGTSTEIYEYLRLLYARIGKTISPVSGMEVKKHQVSDIVKEVLGYPAGTRFAVYAPVVLPDGRGIKEQLEILQKEGYTRLSIGETVYRIGEVLADDTLLSSPGDRTVDRPSGRIDEQDIGKAVLPIPPKRLSSKGTILVSSVSTHLKEQL